MILFLPIYCGHGHTPAPLTEEERQELIAEAKKGIDQAFSERGSIEEAFVKSLAEFSKRAAGATAARRPSKP